MRLLRRHGNEELPKTARTLQGSLREVELSTVSSMKYHYLGLAHVTTSVVDSFTKTALANVDNLVLALNIDGLPLFKSSSMCLWPILCCITNLKPCKVFPVALACVETKPKTLDFLKDTITNMKVLLYEGLMVAGKKDMIDLSCVVCDAPARAMVKHVKQYSGYSGCDKCNIKGLYLGRMTYPDILSLPLRTDHTFREQVDPRHHTGYPPFYDLPIDMVNSFQ